MLPWFSGKPLHTLQYIALVLGTSFPTKNGVPQVSGRLLQPLQWDAPDFRLNNAS